jgi:hypothetical protein
MGSTPYQGLPGFNIGDDESPPPPSKPALQRSFTPKPNNDTSVTLRGVRVPLNSDVGGAFTTDLARNKEQLVSDAQIIEKYDITPDDWTAITQSKAVRLAVNAEHERRTFNNDAAREAAAKFFTQAPSVLNGILQDQKAPFRSRIEASKELRATARAGDEKAGDTPDRVIIEINLGADEKLVVDSGPLPKKRTQEAIDAETERW